MKAFQQGCGIISWYMSVEFFLFGAWKDVMFWNWLLSFHRRSTVSSVLISKLNRGRIQLIRKPSPMLQSSWRGVLSWLPPKLRRMYLLYVDLYLFIYLFGSNVSLKSFTVGLIKAVLAYLLWWWQRLVHWDTVFLSSQDILSQDITADKAVMGAIGKQ